MSFKILITGQGVAGSILAFQCIRRGAQVVIIDKGHHSSASFVAVGLVNPLSLKRITPVWEVSNCVRAFHEVHQFIKQTLHTNLFFPSTIHKVLKSQTDVNAWQEKQDMPVYSDFMNDAILPGVDSTISGLGIGPVTGGGWVNTKEFLRITRNYFLENHLLFEEEFLLSDLHIGQNHLDYKGQDYDFVIDCSGLGFELQSYFPKAILQGNKGEVMSIRLNEALQNDIYSSAYFMLRHSSAQYRVGATYSKSYSESEPTSEGVQELKNGLEKFYSGNYEVIGHEAGIRPTVYDRKPIIGMSPISSQVGMLNGLGSRGYLMAPYLSELLLDAIVNRSAIPKEVSYQRFEKYVLNNG